MVKIVQSSEELTRIAEKTWWKYPVDMISQVKMVMCPLSSIDAQNQLYPWRNSITLKLQGEVQPYLDAPLMNYCLLVILRVISKDFCAEPSYLFRLKSRIDVMMKVCCIKQIHFHTSIEPLARMFFVNEKHIPTTTNSLNETRRSR